MFEHVLLSRRWPLLIPARPLTSCVTAGQLLSHSGLPGCEHERRWHAGSSQGSERPPRTAAGTLGCTSLPLAMWLVGCMEGRSPMTWRAAGQGPGHVTVWAAWPCRVWHSASNSVPPEQRPDCHPPAASGLGHGGAGSRAPDRGQQAAGSAQTGAAGGHGVTQRGPRTAGPSAESQHLPEHPGGEADCHSRRHC